MRLLRGRGARGWARRPWDPAEAIFCLAVRLESKSDFPSLLPPFVVNQLILDKQGRGDPKPGLRGGEH